MQVSKLMLMAVNVLLKVTRRYICKVLIAYFLGLLNCQKMHVHNSEGNNMAGFV